MADLRLLIHVGLHKTATSWLQREVFSREELGFHAPWTVASAEAIEDFVLPHPRRFDPEATRRRYQPTIDACLRSGAVPVLSHEGLSGQPFQGRFHGHEVAERLHATFPGARLLIVVREQRTMLRSLYSQYVRQGGIHPLRAFLGPTADERPGFRPLLRLEHLEFDLLFGHYRSLFGSENVLLLPYELLGRDARDFVERVRRFAGPRATGDPPLSSQRANVAWGAATLALGRRLNRLVSRDPLGRVDPASYRLLHRSLGALDRATPGALHRPLETRWRAFIAERVEGRFAESNRRTAALSGLDFGALGYDLSGERAAEGAASCAPARRSTS